MPLISYKRGQGSIVVRVKILNSSVTTGAGLTGLTISSTGLRIGTIADNEATTTAYTAAGSTIETITTLGTYAAPTATKCRFKELDSTSHPGIYEIQLADARYAVSSAKSMIVSISGSASNIAETDVLVPLVDLDPYTAQPIAASVTGAVGSVTGNVGGNVTGSVGSVTGAVGSVTGNVGGNVTGSVGSVVGAVGSVTGNVGGNVTGSVGSVASGGITAASIATDAIDADALASDAVTEIWAKTMTELSAVPSASASMLAAITWLFEMARNKYTETSTTGTLFKDDGSTTLATITVSDDGTTFTRSKAT